MDTKPRSEALQYYYDNKERLLPIMRERSRLNYQKNKQKKLEANKHWRDNNKELNKKLKDIHKTKNFFRYRATLIRKNGIALTSIECATKLFWKWIQQRGRCAYTGRKLLPDSSTHLDHIIPQSKGGANHPDNLQFICSAANIAKSDLSHDEFITLCKDISKHCKI
jgi:CRISPR/Cas system Type II protein with McrA/HNH and RuvC-like nuclease domain